MIAAGELEVWGGPEIGPRVERMIFGLISHRPMGFYSCDSGPAVVVEWLVHEGPDRLVKVYKPFEFVDAAGRSWNVPEGMVSDGASIPRGLWWFGHPLMGDYRRSTLPHDFGCDRLNYGDSLIEYHNDPRAVHRMFYDGMTVDGMKDPKRWLMYQAVNRFGPQGAKR